MFEGKGRWPTEALLLIGAANLFVSGCSTTSNRLNPAPIVTEIPPIASSNSQVQIATASWYGPGFNGRHTASGEVFHQSDLTAASKTLPLGSRAEVTNVATGRSVVVRINDRGPYVSGRSLDLSRAAAQRIGLIGKGVGTVKITRIAYGGGPAEAAPSAAAVEMHSSPLRVGESHRNLGSTLYRRHYRYRRHRIVPDPLGAAVASALTGF